MFKIGDRVRRIDCAGGPMGVGKEGIIKDMFDSNSELRLVIEYYSYDKRQIGIYGAKYYKKVDEIENKIEELSKEICSMNITVDIITKEPENKPFKLEKYIINENATIMFWSDGDKTVIKRNLGGTKEIKDIKTGKIKTITIKADAFDKRLGFLYGYFQKMSGLSKNKANKYIESLELEKEKK